MQRRTFLLGLLSFGLSPRVYAASFQFPDVGLYTEQGKNTTLSTVLESYRGKALLLHAWGPACQPCIADMPILNELEKKIAVHGLYLPIRNTLEEDQEILKKIMTSQNHHAPNSILPSSSKQAFFTSYQAQTARSFVIPTYFFLSKEGECISIEEGTLGSKERRKRVDKTIENLV